MKRSMIVDNAPDKLEYEQGNTRLPFDFAQDDFWHRTSLFWCVMLSGVEACKIIMYNS